MCVGVAEEGGREGGRREGGLLVSPSYCSRCSGLGFTSWLTLLLQWQQQRSTHGVVDSCTFAFSQVVYVLNKWAVLFFASLCASRPDESQVDCLCLVRLLWVFALHSSMPFFISGLKCFEALIKIKSLRKKHLIFSKCFNVIFRCSCVNWKR